MSSWRTDRRLRARALALLIGVGLGLIPLFYFAPWNRSHSPVAFKRTTADATKLMNDRAKALAESKTGAQELHLGHLPRFPINSEIAHKIFPIDGEVQEYDPQVYFRHLPNTDFRESWWEHPHKGWTMKTNSLGLREDGEIPLEKPDLRILVAGDSHTEGVCENSESLAHVLGRTLQALHKDKRIDSINGAKGGYTFYNYLGTLEKFLYLKPDVFVVVVYGGNDFEEVLTPYHFFAGTTRAPGSSLYWEQVQNALKVRPVWLAQDGNSLKYFQEQPSEIKVALQAAEESTLDIQELCEKHGIRLYYVYLPALFDGEDPEFVEDPARPNLRQKLYEALEVRPKSGNLHDHMANVLIAFLNEHKIPVLDMRKVFKENKGPFYWREDFHINVNAHRLIGRKLALMIHDAWQEFVR